MKRAMTTHQTRSLPAWWSILTIALAAVFSYALPRGAVAADPAEPILPVPQTTQPKDKRFELGKILFSTKRLSRGNQRSCATCHDVQTNGAESLKVSVSPSGRPLKYNAPTVFNAALNFRQHWDGEARSQRDQAALSIKNEGIMNETWDDLGPKLAADANINSRFAAAFNRPIDQDGIIDALVAYEATLLTPDSRFDLWLKGDKAALSKGEVEGYLLFKSAGCVACHQGVNVGGNLFAKTGVFQPLLKKPVKRMRVPSLRNVAVTAPYFDDGSAATLDEAVRRMAEAQLGRKLTPPQIDSIVAFLKTLTGRYEGRPLRAAP